MWLKSMPNSVRHATQLRCTFEERRLVLVVFFDGRLHIPETEIVVVVVAGRNERFIRLLGSRLSSSRQHSKRVDTHPVVSISLTVVALRRYGCVNRPTISQKNQWRLQCATNTEQAFHGGDTLKQKEKQSSRMQTQSHLK